MLLLDGAHHPELLGNLLEAFLFGLPGHSVIHIRPLVILSVGGFGQILYGGADATAAEVLEPDLGVFLFIIGRLFKDLGDLDIAVFLGLGSKVGVLVAGLGFTGEGLLEVLLGLGSFQFFHMVDV